MPDNKKHHYVPKFYLRNFSAGADRRSIHLFNLRVSKAIFDANLKNPTRYKPVAIPRDPEFLKAYEEFQEGVRDGQHQPMDFIK